MHPLGVHTLQIKRGLGVYRNGKRGRGNAGTGRAVGTISFLMAFKNLSSSACLKKLFKFHAVNHMKHQLSC